MTLEDLKKIVDAATPGPWTIDGIGIYGRSEEDEPLVGHVIVGQRADAEFTIAARTWLPLLIKEVEALRKERPLLIQVAKAAEQAKANFMAIDDGFHTGAVPPEMLPLLTPLARLAEVKL
jgi:hypothetical protein